MFREGQVTSYVDIDIVDDNLIEKDEDLIVRITSGDIQVGTGEIRVIIHDNDGGYRFGSSRYEVPEPGQSVTITIEREGSIIEAAEARVETIPFKGDALATQDYTPISNHIVEFEASEAQATFIVTILDDELSENNEEFYVRIVSVTDGRVANPDEATVVILDDDSGRRTSGLSVEAIVGISVGGGVLIFILFITIVIGCCCVLNRRVPQIDPRAPLRYGRETAVTYNPYDVYFTPRDPLTYRR
ncbi:adhesion G-protein coupled receptor V1-like [Amphiura filiformis]|uniref:adhesion G-protein coupled receptor V1-like n=1 Tax=Amphiura filiformis TaxID=82378 RepID=UPI003B21D267